ncbi:MAG TPA: amidase family protein [Polyangiaceae bacterium]|nr:amidase family protein [Polyangiaceae bacterium]
MTDFSELARLDAMAQAELCRRGEVSAAELWDACQARLDALEPSLRCVLTPNPERPTPASGPLAGVPFLVKDSQPWPGLRWTLGSRLFRERVTSQQTDYGKRLAQSGLVCAGKTALSEFGLLASTESLLSGITHNPWDLARSPLGSSGGSAAAVAAGLVPLAHANDGGGSIRVPASACGIFGFKPSRGRTVNANRSGSDFAEMTSEHCLSRSVRDSALFLSLTEDLTRPDVVGFVSQPSPKRLRIGAFTSTMNGDPPEPSVLSAHEASVKLLTELGHRVEPMTAPTYALAELGEAFYLVAAVAIANVVETIDRTRSEPVQQHELEPFTWSLLERLRERGGDVLSDTRAAFAGAVREYREKTAGFDAVLTPAVAAEPPLLGELSPVLSREVLMSRSLRVLGYTPVHNIAGCPAMSLPLYWSERGLPIGTQLAAAPGQDALLMSLAYELEAARPWRERWPPYSIPALF